MISVAWEGGIDRLRRLAVRRREKLIAWSINQLSACVIDETRHYGRVASGHLFLSLEQKVKAKKETKLFCLQL